MMKLRFSHILIIFTILFSLLTYSYYNETRNTAIENANTKIDELLVNYQAFRTYVAKVQKQEVYRLQESGIIDKDYFNPKLLSSTYSAQNVNIFYNKLRKKQGLEPIVIRFASNNPRNIKNKASLQESNILEQFNNNKLTQFSEIITKDDKTVLYYIIPTKRTTQKCMKCHSDPKYAPKGLIDIYGDKNGFYEKPNQIRAILSIIYPLNEDLELADNRFLKFTFITFIVFVILIFVLYKVIKNIENKNEVLEDLNKSLDLKVIDRTKELDDEKDYIKTILDTNPNIILVTKDKKLFSANKRYYEFFNFESMEDFMKEHHCICEYFKEVDDVPFTKDHMINGVHWSTYLSEHQNTNHIVLLEKEDKDYYFRLTANPLNNDEVLLTLENITEDKKKDTLLFEQSKLSSMGEMIGNIAHQWRQPLSVISTAATGIKLQKECNILTDEALLESCDTIYRNTQYLSQTIDDFKNFIKGDRSIQEFDLKETLDSFLTITKPDIKSNSINVHIDFPENIQVNGYPNELLQCLINIFNNAKDVLQSFAEHDRHIFIKAKKEDDKIIIKIKDSGGGIPSEIISKVFEPYFTTKHQSQGTGLGLHMTYKLIVEGMQGTVKVENISYAYETKEYNGAEFTIIF